LSLRKPKLKPKSSHFQYLFFNSSHFYWRVQASEPQYVGAFTIEVQQISCRYPHWREEFEARLGAGEALRVIDATKPKVSEFLVINGKRV
jgi:hypothetical protein